MKITELQIELAGVCNIDCPYCTWKTRSTGKSLMDYDLAIRLLHEAKDAGIGLVTLHSIGEPTLHPHFSDVLDEAERICLKSRVSTNCLRLSGTIAEHIRRAKNLEFIMAIHHSMPPDKLNKAFLNARNYLKDGYENRLTQALMVCTEDLQDKVQDFVDAFLPFTSDPRFEIHLKQPQTWPHDTPNKGADLSKWVGIKGILAETTATPRSLGHSCAMPEFLMAVLADGTVAPCCVGQEEWGLGKVNTTTLMEVWTSERMMALRDKWRRADDSLPCGHCKKRTDC